MLLFPRNAGSRTAVARFPNDEKRARSTPAPGRWVGRSQISPKPSFLTTRLLHVVF